MAYRLTWIASLALLGLVIARLSRLLLPTEAGLPWAVVLIMAGALGGIVTWAATQARLAAVWVAAINVVLFGLFLFIYVGGDIADSAVPPLNVLDDIGREMSDALSVFRFSAPPVTPLVGLVGMIGVLLWTMTGLAVWGVMRNNPYLSIVPPIVLYLQLAVIDRHDSHAGWVLAFLLLVGFGLTAISGDQRSGGGHAGSGFQAARVRGVAVPLLSIAMVASGAFVATSALGDEVPDSGLIDWRTQAGLGAGFGSVSYNPFIDVQRSLVSNSTTPVFTASLTGNTDDVYWRLLTMDTFNGDWWFASESELETLDKTGWESDRFAFRGRTEPVEAEVTILQLQTQWLPAPYSPTSVTSDERLISTTTRVSPNDASMHIDGVTRRGMVYQLTAEVPQPDVGVLAGGGDGALSPLFNAAAQDNRFQPVPRPASAIDMAANDVARYTNLPRGFSPAIAKLARDLTFGLETDFEKGLALENFFRGPASTFTYSIDIPPNERDSGLDEWLLESESPGYRTGYCEQFSASMGVMARSLGIPTRTVLGFTPGERRSDGTILVRDRNAHAWVELWIGSQGWVRFDPTPRGDGVNPSMSADVGFGLDGYLAQVAAEERARLDSLSVSPPIAPPQEVTPGDEIFVGSGGLLDSVGGFELPSWLLPTILWSLLAGLVLGTVPFLKRRRKRRRMRRLEDGEVEAAWAEMVDQLLDSGFWVDPSSTPAELATATDVAMRPLASVYSEATYGPDAAVPVAAVDAASASLDATVDRIKTRMSRWERTRRVYRMKSLLPDWIKKARHRRTRS